MAFNPDNLSLLDMSSLFQNETEAFNFALEADILADNTYCECGGIFCLIHDASDKYHCRVRCDICGTRKSIFDGTIFQRSKIGINKILLIIYFWSQKYNIKETVRQTHISEPTVISYFQSLRDACDEWATTQMIPIGGVGDIVEIDETQMAKRKNQQGRVLPNSDIWVFGGISRNTNKMFAVQVPDRTSASLIPPIQKYILPGTTIYSDSWSAYNGIVHAGDYQHFEVNHKQNFIDPATGCHTQKIERQWRELKTVNKRYNGLHRQEIQSHVGEFLWRKNNDVSPGTAFRKTLELLATVGFKKN